MARTKRAGVIVPPTRRANNVALGPGASQLTAAPANAAAAGGQCPLLELFSDELLLQCTSFLSHADDLARLECTCRRFAAKTIVCAADLGELNVPWPPAPWSVPRESARRWLAAGHILDEHDRTSSYFWSKISLAGQETWIALMHHATKIKADELCKEYDIDETLQYLYEWFKREQETDISATSTDADVIEEHMSRIPEEFVDPRFEHGLESFDALPELEKYEQMKAFVQRVEAALNRLLDPAVWDDDDRRNLDQHVEAAKAQMRANLERVGDGTNLNYLCGAWAPAGAHSDPNKRSKEFQEYVDECEKGLTRDAVARAFVSWALQNFERNGFDAWDGPNTLLSSGMSAIDPCTGSSSTPAFLAMLSGFFDPEP